MSHDVEVENPCAGFGSEQKAALVWFFVVVIGGFSAVGYLCRIDSWMWQNNAEVLNYTDYRKNRVAATTLGSERLDMRSVGSLAAQTSEVK